MKQEREGERSIIWSQRGAMHETTVPTAELNDLYLNTAFAGPTQQCDPETCTLLEETLDIKPTAGLAETHTVRFSFFIFAFFFSLSPCFFFQL